MRPRRRDEVAIGLALTAEALFLHWLYWRNAGPLWRDEIDSAVVAQTPWSHLYDRMQFVPFPGLWVLLVRGWTFLFSDSVVSLRTLGVLTGVLLIAAVWFALRTFDVDAPMLAIAAGAATATVVRFGDALRAYGLGVALGLVSMALLYRTCVEPSRKNFVIAALASLAAAQTTYHNAPLLFACCVAAAIVHRDRRRAAIVLGIGVLCALSLLVYLPNMRKASGWNDLVRYNVDLGWLATRFREAADLGGGGGAIAFAFLWLAAIIAAGVLLWRARGRDGALLFCAIVLVLHTAAHTAFLLAVGYITQVWYYLFLIVVAAVLIDAIVALALERFNAPRMIRAAAAVFLAFAAFDGTRAVVALRTTNVDTIAATLQRSAAPGDFVIVYPWHLGASFNRYYRGAAPWQTLPPLSDQSVQRYDEAHLALRDTRERADVARAVATLRRGGHVWFVGLRLFMEQAIYVHEQGKSDPRVDADTRWSSELENALRGENAKATMVVGPDPHTAHYENVALMRIDAR